MTIKRNILLNPGPSTTTDTVKMAQVVPDICPREEEFGNIMKEMRSDLVRIVHGDPQEYTAVLFCGSGTINIDVCLNSLLPEGKKILVVNNGAYSARAVEICEAYTITGSGSGHFIVLTGVTRDGYITIADCASRERTGKVYSVETIKSYGRDLSEGAFWIVGKK